MFNFLNKSINKDVIDYVDGDKLLSIVIPSYNHEKYIYDAIQSVLNQTYRNLELIIVDDGSSDNSLEIIKSIHDNRVRLIEQENAGAHNAINRGLRESKGDYLAILNSDDVYEIDRFEKMISFMEKNIEYDFVCSYITVINSKGKILGVKEGWRNMEPWTPNNKSMSFASSDDYTLNLIMSNFTSTTSNFLFTRKLYERIGGMRNLRFAHDWDFALRAAEVAECKIIEEPLMRYRVHESNTISSNRKWMLFEIAWVWAANVDRFFAKDIFRDKSCEKDIFRLMNSINLQGNDKVFWGIVMFIIAQKKLGIANPENILLEDEMLRKDFLEFVVE